MSNGVDDLEASLGVKSLAVPKICKHDHVCGAILRALPCASRTSSSQLA